VRRKNTFDRLKYRAEREGKSVSVVDGILSVEGIAVFSVSFGHINTHGV
jgi:hypothetical protein